MSNLDKRMCFATAAAIFLAFAVCGLRADSIHLKNGTTLDGQIVTQTRTRISIRTASGVRQVEKTDVRRVVFSKMDPREAARQKAAQEARRKAEAEERRAAEAEAARQAAEESRKAQEERRGASEEAEPAETTASRTWLSALWRSALLPGWGQYYQGRTGAALAYGTGALLTGTWTAMNSQAYQSRQSAYSAAAGNLGLTVVVLGAALPLVDADLTLRPALFGLQAFTAIERNAAYDRVQSASQNLRLSTALFAAIYVMSLVDVVVFQPSPTSAVAVYAGHTGVGMQFQMRW